MERKRDDIDRIYNLQKRIMQGKAKYNYKLALIVMIPALIAIIIPFILYSIEDMRESKLVAHLMMWTVTPILVFSFFLLLRYKLIGHHGEVIILLIPTLIWLLPEHHHAVVILINVSMGIGGLMLVMFVATMLFMKMKNLNKGARYSALTSKFQFTFAAMLITMAISITLIDFGDDGMGWLNDIKGVATASSESWVVFIAITSIIIIMLLILEGLFSDFIVVKYFEIDDKTTEINLENISEIRRLARSHKQAKKTNLKNNKANKKKT